MKLARLRQMRETIGQLDRIVKEERRELAWSRQGHRSAGRSGRGSAIVEPGWEAILHDQKVAVLDTETAKQENGEATRKKAGVAIRGREVDIRARTGKLALDPAFATLEPPHLKQAAFRLGDAVTYLGKTDLFEALGEVRGSSRLIQKRERSTEGSDRGCRTRRGEGRV